MPDCDSISQVCVVLNSGKHMPLVGYGTYQIPPTSEGMQAIGNAIASGYRLLDCASFYKNEASIGHVIAKHDRSKLFIVSKVWNDAIYSGADAVRNSCLQSIKDLQCGYLDLILVHWPVPGKHVDAYRALAVLKAEGLVNDIGVSNYTIENLQELENAGITDPPAVNQIEINPFLNRTRTIQYLKDKGIVPMSYRGLRNSTALHDPDIIRIAHELGVTAAQVLGRWLVQKRICHIPKSMQLERMRSNADLFSFELSPAHMNFLDNMTTPAILEAFRARHLEKIVGNTPMADCDPVNIRFTID